MVADGICGIGGFLDSRRWWPTVRVMIVGLRIGTGGIGLRLVLGGRGFWGGLVVTGSGTAGQGQGPHCCAESKSSHQSQFVHQCSYRKNASLDGSAPAKISRHKGHFTLSALPVAILEWQDAKDTVH